MELEQFAYVASHDLQEPLRMVSSYVQLIARRYRDKLDKDAEEFIDFAVDGATRMKILINDLLEFSRISSRAKPFDTIDLDDCMKEILKNLEFKIEETNALISYDRLPKIIGDRIQIQRVFSNLILNGIKFQNPNNIPKIHISVTEENNHFKFGVHDNGIGIDPQFFNKLFIIFQRLHGKDEYGGTGIGLAICKRIIDRHNGKIWVESKLNEGANFYFLIPKVNKT